jgi:hypothetical protein
MRSQTLKLALSDVGAVLLALLLDPMRFNAIYYSDSRCGFSDN